MLTRSPALPRSSANVSPSFHVHYAYTTTADLPLISPSRSSIATSLSRRQSASSSPQVGSVASPLLQAQPPRPSKRYIDAATQWSPIPVPAPIALSPGGSSSGRDIRDIPPTPPGPRAMTPGIEQGAGQTEPPRARPNIISATNYNHFKNSNSSFSADPIRSAPLAGGGGSNSSPGMDSSRDVREGSSRRHPAATPSASSSAASKKRNEPAGPDHEGHTSSPAAEQSSSPKRPRAASRPLRALPSRYEACPVSDMVVLIANMIGELIETNDPLQGAGGHLTRFHSRTAPGISVVEYLRRLAKHATVPTPLLLVVVYYMDRLCAVYKEFTINTLTVHRFLITAVTVASKGLSDAFWNNTTYARVGGLKVAELRLLELEFLYRMDWKIIPNPESLEQYYRGLVQRHPGYCFQEGDGQGGGQQSQQQQSNEDEEPGEGPSRVKGKRPEEAQAQPGETQDDEDSEENDDVDDEMDDETGEGETPDTGTTSPSRS